MGVVRQENGRAQRDMKFFNEWVKLASYSCLASWLSQLKIHIHGTIAELQE